MRSRQGTLMSSARLARPTRSRSFSRIPTSPSSRLQQVFLNAQDYDLTIINHVEERDIGNYANPKYYWHYDNADVTNGLKQADAEPDQTKRNALYKQIQQQLADDAANLWIAAPNNLGILKKGFQGYQVQGISPALYLADAYFA